MNEKIGIGAQKWVGYLFNDDKIIVKLYTNKSDCDEYKKIPNIKSISGIFEARCDLEAYLKAHDYFFKSIMTLK